MRSSGFRAAIPMWVGNASSMEGDFKGSAVKIGLVIGGTPIEGLCTLDNRQTLEPPFEYNTCVDRKGKGGDRC